MEHKKHHQTPATSSATASASASSLPKHKSYSEYVAALAKIDEGFQKLDAFFQNPPRYLDGDEYANAKNHIKTGGVEVLDFFDSGYVSVREYHTPRFFDACERDSIKTVLTHDRHVVASATGVSVDTFTLGTTDQEASQVRENDGVEDKPQLRVVFVNYYRDWAFGKYLGLDKNVLDFIALKYSLHPEILRLHFGSQYGLRLPPLETETDEVAELPVLVQSQCVTLRYGFGFLTACSIKDEQLNGLNTVVILARNSAVESPLLLARINSLDLNNSLPDLDTIYHSTNEIFLSHLKRSSQAADDIRWIIQNPLSVLVSYGLITVESDHFWMRYMQRTLNAQSQTGNLTAVYYEQRSHVAKIRSNKQNIWKIVRSSLPLAEGETEDVSDNIFGQQLYVFKPPPSTTDANMRMPLKSFTHKPSASEVKRNDKPPILSRMQTLMTGHRTLHAEASEQLESLRLVMSYYASIAALEESRVSTHYSREGISYTKQALEQNGRVKMLTQLAFVFVPLGAMASVFGMNLKVLNAGDADVWMFVLAVLIAYLAVLCVWALLSPRATWKKVLLVFGLSQARKDGIN